MPETKNHARPQEPPDPKSHRIRDGTLARSTLKSNVTIMRFSFRDDLGLGMTCGHTKTQATCRKLLAGETHLRAFVRVEEVGPTNNDAERALRNGLICPKTGSRTDSKAGNRFAERILSVIASCRQQNVNVLEYLSRCYQSPLDGIPAIDFSQSSSLIGL